MALKELSATLAETDPDIPYLIEPGILPLGGKAILYGLAGIGKSLLVQQLAFSIACGVAWAGAFPVKQGIVAYVQCEVPPSELRKRLRRQMAAFSTAPPGTLYTDTSLTLQVTPGDAEWRELRGEIIALRPALVILDPQYKLFPGDENDNTQVRQFYWHLDELITLSGCAVLLVTHSRKTRVDTGGAVIDMGFQEIGGAGRQTHWPDAVLRLGQTKTGAYLRVEKIRYGAAIESVSLGPLDEHWCRTKADARTRVDVDIVALLDERGATTQLDLVHTLLAQGASESTVKRALDRLEASGFIKREPIPGNRAQNLVMRRT